MQSSDKEGKRKAEVQPDAELSAAWRALLGISEEAASRPQGDALAQVQPLASDPWSLLLHTQGMQSIDLQKVHLQDLRSGVQDNDVEHALDIMQEATNQASSQDERSKETR